MSTSGGHAPYGSRHVVPVAVSLAGVKRHRWSRFSPACTRCRLPWAGDIGGETWYYKYYTKVIIS